MERLAFLPIGMVIALVAVRFELSYASTAILLGIALAFLDRLRGRAPAIDGRFGFFWVAFGALLVGGACLLAERYGISLATLDRDKSFPRIVRHLPGFGIACMSMGATILALACLQRRQS